MDLCTTPGCTRHVSRPGFKLCYVCWKEQNAQPQGQAQTKGNVTASTLGTHFAVSSQRINLTLAELGWIERAIKGWTPTAQGAAIGGRKADFRGRPYALWPAEILQNPILCNALKESASVVEGDSGGTAPGSHLSIDPRQAFHAQYRTADGHYVRSRAELAIDNWLYMQGIVHAYERRLPISETVISDFYLPAQRVYIEFWGKSDPDYMRRRKEKEKLYLQHGMKLVDVEEAHLDNPSLPR